MREIKEIAFSMLIWIWIMYIFMSFPLQIQDGARFRIRHSRDSLRAIARRRLVLNIYIINFAACCFIVRAHEVL